MEINLLLEKLDKTTKAEGPLDEQVKSIQVKLKSDIRKGLSSKRVDNSWGDFGQWDKFYDNQELG